MIRLILAGNIRGDTLDALRAEVHAAVFADQCPHIWNEELLWRILLYVFELQIREFLQEYINEYMPTMCI